MYATWLDSNSWLLEVAEKRILVDPWLVGDLVFGGQGWLFKGTRPRAIAVPEPIDLILLTQGLEDHAHPPTLEALDKEIPVVASPNGAKVAQGLGYTKVTALDHGESFSLGGAVEIKAVPGSPIGPTLVENGYVIRDPNQGTALFYEPHGFHQASLKEEGPVDVVITPVIDIALPLLGPVLRGQKGALELIHWLQPQVVLPTADAGEVQYQGLLVSLLKALGGPTQLQTELGRQGLPTRVLEPAVGKRMDLELTPKATAS